MRCTARMAQPEFRTEIAVGGHALVADEPASRGGGDAGPAPYDLLLASLAACTSMTLRIYAARKDWPLEGLEVELSLLGMGETLRIRRTLAIGGLDAEQQARLADIAERTPVTLTLKRGLPIDTRLAPQE
ncbi:OsmC family protein [Sphingosinithalassobacter portus]|uniref:OsmC family protein n=1 Tax=Stakelama portus TaxID=2676234 RepID=UPI000D6E2C9D|nr:OsmC family protein [Sphingosinithalassobacter portus]